jgi:hypothetical protein
VIHHDDERMPRADEEELTIDLALLKEDESPTFSYARVAAIAAFSTE